MLPGWGGAALARGSQAPKSGHLFVPPDLGIGLQSFALTAALPSPRWGVVGLCMDALLGCGLARESPIPSAALPQLCPGRGGGLWQRSRGSGGWVCSKPPGKRGPINQAVALGGQRG